MLGAGILSILGRYWLNTTLKNAGFALPIAIALGLVMIAFAGTSILVAQNDRNNAVQRRTSGASLLVSDSAVARAMLQLSNPNNGVLLVRNYDPINPTTGRNYLGVDSIPKNGDETATAVDEWTGNNLSSSFCFQQLGWAAPNIALTGTITLEGVVWAEEIVSSKNAASNRAVTIYLGEPVATREFESLVTPGATSGVAVPDDVSSLTDVLDYVNWPVRYRYGTIQNWLRVN